MPTEIVMPKLGLTMTTGTLVGWLARVGDEIRAGTPLLEVESDKANYEIPAPTDGILAKILLSEGDDIPVGQVIGYLATPGESMETHAPSTSDLAPASPMSDQKKSDMAASAPMPVSLPPPQATELEPAQPEQNIPRVSPAARRLAKELNIDPTQLVGSGPGGRVVMEDVQAAAQPSSATPIPEPVRIPMRGIRRTIAERMQRSLEESAQLTLFAQADVTALVALRQRLNTTNPTPVSYNDIFLYVVSRALALHPSLNSRLEENEIVQLPEIHLGLAVDTPRGLVVPVIHNTDHISLRDLVTQRSNLLARIEQNTITQDDLHGSTFTLTNLGGFGIDGFTPILNPPECAILGFGRITPQLMVREADDALVVRRMMTMSLTVDHRLVDGAPAARFLATVTTFLADPTQVGLD